LLKKKICFSIFDESALNTSKKNLNYQEFKRAYLLYFNRNTYKLSSELRKEIMSVKDSMNKKELNLLSP